MGAGRISRRSLFSGEVDPSSLMIGLSSHWALNDTVRINNSGVVSPIRYNSISSDDLYPNLSPTLATVSSGYGARFVYDPGMDDGTVESYVVPGNYGSFGSGTEGGIVGWLVLNDKSVSSTFLDKPGSYSFYYDHVSDRLKVSVTLDNASTLSATCTGLGSPTIDVPIFFSFRIYTVSTSWFIDIKTNTSSIQTVPLGSGRSPAQNSNDTTLGGGSAVTLASWAWYHRAITNAELVELYNNGTPLQAVQNLKSNIVAHWDFASGTELTDSVGSHTLTNHGVTFGSGLIGQAAIFNGSSWLSTPHTSLLAGSGNKTVAAWVKVASANINALFATIVSKGEYNSDYTLYLNSGNYRLAEGTASAGECIGQATADIWQLIVFRRHNTYPDTTKRISLNVNGENVGYRAKSTNSGTSPLLIGDDNFGDFLIGQIDSITIWDSYINDNEIIRLYNSGAGLSFSSWGASSSLYDAVLFLPLNQLPGKRDFVEDVYPEITSGKFSSTATRCIKGSPGTRTGGLFSTSSSALTIGASSKTLAIWTKVDNVTGFHPVIWKAGPVNTEYKLYLNAGETNFKFETDNSSIVTSTITVSANQFYLIVCGYDSDLDKVFIQVNNETRVLASGGGGSSSFNDETVPFIVGGTGSPFSEPSNPDDFDNMSGVLDQLCIWNRALTSSEVSALWNSGSGRAYPFA